MAHEPGKSEGLQLLALSEPLDNVHVPASVNAVFAAALVALHIRARRFVKAVFCLLDQGLSIEAEVLNRALLETTVLARWIAKDPSSRVDRWRLSDLEERIKWHDGYEKAATAQGLQPNDSSLIPAERYAEFVDEAARLRSEGVKSVPDLLQMSEDIGNSDIYHLAYRQGCQSFAHPQFLALERFMDWKGDGSWDVRANAPSAEVDTEPYETAAIWLYLIMEIGAEAPGIPWRKEHLKSVEESILGGIARRTVE